MECLKCKSAFPTRQTVRGYLLDECCSSCLDVALRKRRVKELSLEQRSKARAYK